MATPGEQHEVRILLLGDSNVGKSLFLSRLTVLKDGPGVRALPILRDSDQPFNFDLSSKRGLHRLEFYDTASPESYVLLQPAVLVLCFSIADRASLESLHKTWKDVIELNFNYNNQIPVIVLGLKRDLREKDNKATIHPNEAIAVAQGMRCDKYCECSAVTGELMDLVFEDIATTAALTTTDLGGQSRGPDCSLM